MLDEKVYVPMFMPNEFTHLSIVDLCENLILQFSELHDRGAINSLQLAVVERTVRALFCLRFGDVDGSWV